MSRLLLLVVDLEGPYNNVNYDDVNDDDDDDDDDTW